MLAQIHWLRQEQKAQNSAHGPYCTLIHSALPNTTGGHQRTVKETFLSDHLEGTLAVILPPPVPLAAGIEPTSEQVAPVSQWVPHLIPYTLHSHTVRPGILNGMTPDFPQQSLIL